MVQINFGQREVSCKLVFYGPGMSGKTTNLEIIHQKAPESARGEMVSIATETDRTLYFDYLPLDLGQVAGMHTKFQLYTVPGQIYYNATRKLVLQGVDGVIFVADSASDKMSENLESLQNLRDNIAEQGLNLEDLSMVIQYNKRDLPNAMSISMLDEQLNPMGLPTTEACARDGKGVFPTLKLISKLVIEKLNESHAPSSTRRRTGSNMTPPAQAAVPAAAPIPVAPVPVAPVPVAPVAAPIPVTPVPVAPVAAPAAVENSKNQHLQKAPPPRVSNRNMQDMSDTNPNLRSYRDQKNAGKGKLILSICITILVLLAVLYALVKFVEPVRDAVLKHFPESIQNHFPEYAADPTDASATPVTAPTAPAPQTPTTQAGDS